MGEVHDERGKERRRPDEVDGVVRDRPGVLGGCPVESPCTSSLRSPGACRRLGPQAPSAALQPVPRQTARTCTQAEVGWIQSKHTDVGVLMLRFRAQTTSKESQDIPIYALQTTSVEIGGWVVGRRSGSIGKGVDAPRQPGLGGRSPTLGLLNPTPRPGVGTPELCLELRNVRLPLPHLHP